MEGTRGGGKEGGGWCINKKSRGGLGISRGRMRAGYSGTGY